jgi:hypothetical protein
MKLDFKLLIPLFFVTFVGFSQIQPVGHLTIFSEDGDRFQLVLNGELINDVPQTNLRVEDLNQPYYNAKIIFENKQLSEISKNNLMIADVDGIFTDVTYKIRRDKNKAGKMKMNFFSQIPVRQDFIPASNVHVIHYGQPRSNIGFQQNGISQTTTTTTTQSGVNVGANVNIGGISMGVSINDNLGDAVVTQTTTTTHSNSDHNYQDQHENHRSCVGRYAMNSNDFSSALSTLKNQGFDETKLKTAKQIAAANCLNVNQIIQIANLFGFEESKLEFAKFAYDYCVEPKKYFNLNNIFAFSTSVDELTDYIQSKN